MQLERGQMNRRDAMNAERNEEEPNQIWSQRSESFPTERKPNLLCVHRVSAVSFRVSLLHGHGFGRQMAGQFRRANCPSMSVPGEDECTLTKTEQQVLNH